MDDWWGDGFHPIDAGWSVPQLRTGDRALPGADDPDHEEHRLRNQVELRNRVNIEPDFPEGSREPIAWTAKSIPRPLVCVSRFRHANIMSISSVDG